MALHSTLRSWLPILLAPLLIVLPACSKSAPKKAGLPQVQVIADNGHDVPLVFTVADLAPLEVAPGAHHVFELDAGPATIVCKQTDGTLVEQHDATLTIGAWLFNPGATRRYLHDSLEYTAPGSGSGMWAYQILEVYEKGRAETLVRLYERPNLFFETFPRTVKVRRTTDSTGSPAISAIDRKRLRRITHVPDDWERPFGSGGAGVPFDADWALEGSDDSNTPSSNDD